MGSTALRDESLELFRRVGVDVRREHLGGDGGGLCRIRGRRIVFVDEDADLDTQVATCVAALRLIPEIEAMYVSPALRERLGGTD